MEKEFVPYELALELKDLGFNEPCLGLFYDGNFQQIYSEIQLDTFILAPTWQSAFKWFREKYSYQSFISPSNELTYLAYDFTLKGFDGYFKSKQFKTYEEAELECLEKLIEIIEEKQK